MNNNEYPKYAVLLYFSDRELILSSGITTEIFHESLLLHVDDFCELFNKGKILWIRNNSGGPNWYIEFKEYLHSIGVAVKFQER